MLHALILQSYYNGNFLTEYPDYTSLKVAIDNYLEDTSNAELTNIYNREMHNIYVDFIDEIANAIVSYSTANNISDVNLEYAKKMVWGSLHGYEISTENLTLIQELEASTILSYEHLNNTENAKGTKTCN